jgi:hypothetical protein
MPTNKNREKAWPQKCAGKKTYPLHTQTNQEKMLMSYQLRIRYKKFDEIQILIPRGTLW